MLLPIDTDNIRKLSDRVLMTCARINRIINGLIGFSRKSEEDPYLVVNLRQLVKDSLDLIEPHYRNNRVSLQVEPVDDALAIRCKPVEISQVLINLLTNALDAAKNQQDKWVCLQVAATETSVTLAVVDSGHGIPNEIAEQIFTPFFTTKPRGSGTGLGLSISQRILQKHGGTIELDRSAPNTTFVIRLPLAQSLRRSA